METTQNVKLYRATYSDVNKLSMFCSADPVFHIISTNPIDAIKKAEEAFLKYRQLEKESKDRSLDYSDFVLTTLSLVTNNPII